MCPGFAFRAAVGTLGNVCIVYGLGAAAERPVFAFVAAFFEPGRTCGVSGLEAVAECPIFAFGVAFARPVGVSEAFWEDEGC